ncbi:MAG: hypothetical protein EOP61_33065, partial [Sphingomonadales bacterium]
MARKATMLALGRWLVLGVALTALPGCDRFDQLGELAGDALKQITGETEQAEAPVDPLASAPVEARALYGVMQAPLELTAISLEEQMQTQSFFAVGSIIAMPKEQIVEPVLEPESFDIAAANAPAAAPDATTLNTNDAPKPASTEAAIGAPIVEAAPPPPAAAAPEATRDTADGAPRIVKPRQGIRATAPPEVKLPPASALRQQAQIQAPKALQEAVRGSGVEVKPETLRSARASAEQTMTATSQTAQSIGDQITRKAQDKAEPVPKPLQVRSRLDVDKAVQVRDKAGRQLEALGLSGVVTPSEGGQMRITIGVNPTQYREGK